MNDCSEQHRQFVEKSLSRLTVHKLLAEYLFFIQKVPLYLLVGSKKSQILKVLV